MGLLSALGKMGRRAAPQAAGMADNFAAPAMAAPQAMSAQGQAFVQRLQQRVAELQQEPFLPPRLRSELNENMELLRRIQSGEQSLG